MSFDEKELYRAAANKAQEHLIKLLQDRGHAVELINHNIVVSKSEDGLQVETGVQTWIHYKFKFSSNADGITVRILRHSRVVNYHRKTDDYTQFDWPHIIAVIEEDLQIRLQEARHRRQAQAKDKSNAELAQAEVPLPVIKRQFEGTVPWLDGFTRTRYDNGTYSISVTGTGFTKEEALAVRDAVLAKLKRTNKT